MQLPSFFELLKDSWAYAKLNFRLLLSIYLPWVIAPVAVLAVIIIILASSGLMV